MTFGSVVRNAKSVPDATTWPDFVVDLSAIGACGGPEPKCTLGLI